MVVFLVFRIAIQISATVYRVCAGPSLDPQTCAHRLEGVWNILSSPDHSAEEAQDALSAAGDPEEGPWVVTDFSGTFELRKLQWRLSRAPAGRVEDVDVMTFHFIKATGGVPGTYNDTTDLAAVESAITSFWSSGLANFCHSFIHSDQYRWYKDGPAFYHSDPDHAVFQPNGDNPAIRITEVDVAGGSGSASALPPQCAITVTEKTSSRRHWGRYYMPVSSTSITDATGLVAASNRTSLLASAVTFYNACRTASMVPVVFSIAKNERPKRPSGTLPAVGAIAYEIAALQMDDIVDVIRSRRFAVGVNKTSTALT